MTWLKRLPLKLIDYAERIMPEDRGEWARAMSAEVRHVQGTSAALAFAAGCLWSAVRERATSIATAPEFAAGLGAGAIYAVHAAIPGSEKWPWIWPALVGVVVAVGPKSLHSSGGLLSALAAGARAGLACGIVFFALAAAFVLARSCLMDAAPSLESRLGLLLYGGVGAVFIAAACATTARFVEALRHRL